MRRMRNADLTCTVSCYSQTLLYCAFLSMFATLSAFQSNALIPGWVFTADTGETITKRGAKTTLQPISVIHHHPKLLLALENMFGAGNVKHLPGSSWVRAKGPAEFTYDHVDYHYFYKHTTIISDHMRLFVDKRSAVASSAGNHCAICSAVLVLEDIIHAGIQTAWHCSACINKPTSIYTLWIPLSDIGVNDSKLAIIPGSHHHSGYEAFRGELPGEFTPLIQSQSVWHLPGQYQMGDVIIFNIKTVHAATKNASDRYRLSVDARFAALPSNMTFNHGDNDG